MRQLHATKLIQKYICVSKATQNFYKRTNYALIQIFSYCLKKLRKYWNDPVKENLVPAVFKDLSNVVF